MYPVESEALTQKSPVKLFISMDDDLKSQHYSTSQLTSTWIYPLGRVIPEMALLSLSNFFEIVDTPTHKSQQNYDYSVSVRLLSFTAEVPSTIFSPTATSIELEYTLRKVSSGETYVLKTESDENVASAVDQLVYERLTEQVEGLNAYTSGVFITAPKYEHLAARDGMLAIHKCTYELAEQVNNLVSGANITNKEEEPLTPPSL
ncbi:hypothetical protein [Microbulbifer aggregans]|uniref:hypothetical protein n=1 Tax=Microbulbifer aggregans TaxID=1769779 RepID=UPI001CFE15EA|nr:hypothetical protein [Microbulbifer aggregans]